MPDPTPFNTRNLKMTAHLWVHTPQ